MTRRHFILNYLWWNFKNFCGRSEKKKQYVSFPCWISLLLTLSSLKILIFSCRRFYLKLTNWNEVGLFASFSPSVLEDLLYHWYESVGLIGTCGDAWACCEGDRKLCLSSTHSPRKRGFKLLLLLTRACSQVMLWLCILHKKYKITMGPIYPSQFIHWI